MPNFFIVDYGLDDREDWVDLDHVVAVTINCEYIPGIPETTKWKQLHESLKYGDVYYKYHTIFYLDTGLEHKMVLSAKGYEKLREATTTQKQGHRKGLK